MILRNTKRLLDLVNQLLDLSKLESGRMKLKVKQQDIITLIRGLAQSFESLAKRKNIEFIFKSPIDAGAIHELPLLRHISTRKNWNGSSTIYYQMPSNLRPMAATWGWW